MNPARAQELNKFILDDHFERLNEVYDKLNLKTHPEKIFNNGFKETGLYLINPQAIPETALAQFVQTEVPAHVPDAIDVENLSPSGQ